MIKLGRLERRYPLGKEKFFYVLRDINLHMYETLYARDEHAGVVPDLAQGAEVSKDGLTYAFALRSGVTRA